MRVISVDSGASQLKISDGTTLLTQPAIVCPMDPGEPHSYADEITVDGRRYMVGTTALIAAGGEDQPHLERGYHGSTRQHVQICHALSQLGAVGDWDAIIHSLPYADHADAAVRSRVKERLVYEWTQGGETHRATFARSATMPQGVGALRWWQAKSKEKPGLVVLADIGSCTADFVVVALDPRTNDYQYVGGLCASFRASREDQPLINCKRFYDSWAARIARMDGMSGHALGYHQLMSMRPPGKMLLRHGPELVDVGPAYLATVAEFTRDVMAKTREHLAGMWHRADRILLTGGGAQLMDLSQIDDERIQRVDVAANAQGQLLAVRPTPKRDGREKEEVAAHV